MNSPAAPDHVRISGPLKPFAGGYITYLVERGYALRTAQFELQFVAHVGHGSSDLAGSRNVCGGRR